MEKSKTAIKWQTNQYTHTDTHTDTSTYQATRNTFCIIENFVLFLEIANQTYSNRTKWAIEGEDDVLTSYLDGFESVARCYRRLATPTTWPLLANYLELAATVQVGQVFGLSLDLLAHLALFWLHYSGPSNDILRVSATPNPLSIKICIPAKNFTLTLFFLRHREID